MENRLSGEQGSLNEPDVSTRPEVVQILQDLLGNQDCAVFYLWGSRGIGKTHEANELSDEVCRHQYRVVQTNGGQVQGPNDLFRLVAQYFGIPSEGDLSLHQVAALFDSQSREGRLLWIIDDVDSRWSSEEWFRETILAVARRQVSILLVGAEPPAHMWPGQWYFQAQLQVVRLMPIGPMQSEQLLRQRGVTDAATIRIALRICQGVPQMLATIADGLAVAEELSLPPEIAVGRRELEVATFMIEQLCHPGSKRVAWRAGQGEGGLDLLVAAASLIPSVNQELITRMIGSELVRTYWDRFTQLPFVLGYRGGYCAISPALRQYVSEVVQKTRPWIWEQWANVATQFALHQFNTGRSDFNQTWRLVGGLTRNRIATTPFFADPSDHGWAFNWEPSAPEGVARICETERILAEVPYSLDDQGCLHLDRARSSGRYSLASGPTESTGGLAPTFAL